MRPKILHEHTIFLVLEPEYLNMLQGRKSRYSQCQDPGIFSRAHNVLLLLYFLDEMTRVQKP
jgi:hypothetical protein